MKEILLTGNLMFWKAKCREGNYLLLEDISEPPSQSVLKAWSSALSLPCGQRLLFVNAHSRPEILCKHSPARGVWGVTGNCSSFPVPCLGQLWWASCVAEKPSPSPEHFHRSVNDDKKPFVGRTVTAEALGWQSCWWGICFGVFQNQKTGGHSSPGSGWLTAGVLESGNLAKSSPHLACSLVLSKLCNPSESLFQHLYMGLIIAPHDTVIMRLQWAHGCETFVTVPGPEELFSHPD